MLWAVAFIMSLAIYCKDSQNHFTVTWTILRDFLSEDGP